MGGYRVVYSHGQARMAAKHLLENATAGRTGCHWDSMMSLVAIAFMVEAGLNYVGEFIFDDSWYSERARWIRTYRTRKVRAQLPPLVKLEYLLNYLGLDRDELSETIELVRKLFDARNTLAHGRVERLRGEVVLNSETREFENLPTLSWEELANEATLRKVFDTSEALIKRLGREAAEQHPELDDVERLRSPFISFESAGGIML